MKGSEEEIDEMIEVVKENVPHPEISDLYIGMKKNLLQDK